NGPCVVTGCPGVPGVVVRTPGATVPGVKFPWTGVVSAAPPCDPGALVPGVKGPWIVGLPPAPGLAFVTPGATLPGLKLPCVIAPPGEVLTIDVGPVDTNAPGVRPRPIATSGDTRPPGMPEIPPEPGTITPPTNAVDPFAAITVPSRATPTLP